MTDANRQNPKLSEQGPLRRLVDDRSGLSTVEYIIILVLIAVVGITVWTQFGETVEGKVGNANTELENMGN